ncbi:muts domain V-domain-containing protein [Rhizoctonia solani]|nr:muts domain V-domain-containing protein [Rhizoctonia solani]
MENSKRSITPSEGEEDGNMGISKRVRWNNKSDSPPAASIFAAVTGYHGRVGGVYYNPENATMYLMEDTTDSSHFDLMRMFLEQIKADVCLVSSRADEHLIIFCQEFMELKSGQCQVRPHKEFIPHKGLAKLQQLSLLARLPQVELGNSDNAILSGAPRNVNEFIHSRRNVENDPNTQRLYAAIRLLNFGGDEAPLCLSSASALLEQLLRIHASEELDETQNHIGALHVNNIEILSLNQVMQVNADALASLQIFDDENHASIHSNKTKEGHSLFQLLNHTSTNLGRSLLRRWILRPSLSIPIITARHAAIECFTLTENVNTASNVRSNLRGLCQVPKTMALLRTGRGRLSEWRGVAKFAYHVNLLKDTVRELSNWESIGAIDQVSSIAESAVHTLKKRKKLLTALDEVDTEETGALINMVIDWEESQNNQRVCINPGVDEALDEKKRIYNGLDDLLIHVARQVSQNMPEGYTNELNVLYFPQLGYLIRIPTPSGWTTNKDFEQIPQWNFQFESEEIEIMEETLGRVLKHDKAIIAVCEAAAEVDCLLSLSFASLFHNWVKPEMTEDNVLEIQGGIHPLQSLLVPTFVPNDAHLVGGRGIGTENDSEDAKSIMVCTGANACGKSVYLKQNALIPFMAQIGCFVPAQSARLGIVDKIFTRLQTREGVSKLQSAFMIDLAQVSLALRNCTARSLIVLDEFGKGSLSTDGAGLFAGVINQLLKRGNDCPKVTPGLCLDSYAAQCARTYGINKSIVERARFASMVVSLNEIGLLLDEDMPREQMEELEVRAAICQRFTSWKMSVDDDMGVKDRLREVLGK